MNDVQVSAGLIGIIANGNEFLVKQGDLAGGWIDEYGPDYPGLQPVDFIAVFGDPANPANDRIAVVHEMAATPFQLGGEALAKQGNLSGDWVNEYGPDFGFDYVVGVALG